MKIERCGCVITAKRRVILKTKAEFYILNIKPRNFKEPKANTSNEAVGSSIRFNERKVKALVSTHDSLVTTQDEMVIMSDIDTFINGIKENNGKVFGS